MYPVTPAYVNAIRALSRVDELTGSVTFADGDELLLSEANIGQGSVSINWQCVDGEELQFGAVPLSQLQMSIRTDTDRYKFFGAQISLTYSVMTASGWFDRPLGCYNVGESERRGGIVQIIAYDNLIRLDKDYDSAVLYGTAFAILSNIMDYCGLDFGMTEAEVASLPNGEETIQIDSASGCSTYRDCAKIVAQLVGCFLAADSDGAIVLKQFGKTPVTTMGAGDRYSLNLADYVCRYSSIAVQSSTACYSAYDPDVENGLELYIKDAPAWDFGMESTLQARAETLLQELVQIIYTPGKIITPGDPAIECGDIIQLTTDDGDIPTLVTRINWKFRGRMTIESAGVNPYLRSQKAQKTQVTRELEQRTEGRRIIYYAFTNSEAINISTIEPVEIARITFVTTEETSALFLAQIPVTATVEDETHTSTTVREVSVKDKDGQETQVLDPGGNPLSFSITDEESYTTPGKVTLEILYYLNGTIINYELKQLLLNGPHILGLFYPFSGLQGKTNSSFSVRMRLISGTGNIGIAQRAIRATISGQGLASTDTWNGDINVEEHLSRHPIRGALTARTFRDEVTAATGYPTPKGITDTAARFTVRSNLAMRHVSDQIAVNPVVVQQTVSFIGNTYTRETDGIISLQTRYVYTSLQRQIDRGQYETLQLETNDKQSIDSIKVVTV